MAFDFSINFIYNGWNVADAGKMKIRETFKNSFLTFLTNNKKLESEVFPILNNNYFVSTIDIIMSINN